MRKKHNGRTDKNRYKTEGESGNDKLLNPSDWKNIYKAKWKAGDNTRLGQMGGDEGAEVREPLWRCVDYQRRR